jgi:hypothetical protein
LRLAPAENIAPQSGITNHIISTQWRENGADNMPYGAAFSYLFKASSTALWYLPISHHVWQPKIYTEGSIFQVPQCIYEHALADSYPTSFVLLGDRCSRIKDFPFQARFSHVTEPRHDFQPRATTRSSQDLSEQSYSVHGRGPKGNYYSESGYALLADPRCDEEDWDFLAIQ